MTARQAVSLSILAVLALFGWRRRQVSYAVSHERFPRASPVRKRRLLRLLKTKYSISLGAAEVGVTLINGKRVIPTSTHFGFNVLVPSLLAWLPLYQIPLCCGSLLVVSPMFGRVS